METLIGDEAYDEQLEYLQDTRKPHDMEVHKWIQRMKTINSYLPTLSNGAISLTEIQLVKMITRNIPKTWKTQFKLADDHKLKTTIEAQKKLRLLEKEEKRQKQINLKDKEVFKRKEDNKSSGNFKNKCTRCKDDKHEWFDCPKYNKNSKLYKAREVPVMNFENNYSDNLCQSRHELDESAR